MIGLGLITAVSAIAPSLMLVWYFHKRDAFPEPGRVLWTTFALGVAIILPVVVIELAIDAMVELVPHFVLRGFLDAFLVAAVPEESFKLLVLLLYAYRHRAFNEPMDGIVYGAVASLGFATLENIMYVAEGGLGVAVMRAVMSVPGHASWGAIMGYFVGRAKFMPTRRLGMIGKGFAAAVILHGLYDFPLLTLSSANAAGASSGAVLALVPITIITIIVSLVLAVRSVRKTRAEQGRTMPPPLPWEQEKLCRRGRLTGGIMMVTGFLSGSAGGLISLALILGFFLGQVSPEETGEVLAGGALIGALPLVLGLLLFVLGIRRLNRPLGRA